MLYSIFRCGGKPIFSLNGCPVAQYHQDIVFYIRKAVRADEKQNEFQSLDMKNIPKNINALKKGVSEPKSSWDKFTGGNKLGRQ